MNFVHDLATLPPTLGLINAHYNFNVDRKSDDPLVPSLFFEHSFLFLQKESQS